MPIMPDPFGRVAADYSSGMARYVVTGVSRGIGRAVAEQLISGGHEVIGVIRPSRADSVSGLPLLECWELELADPASLQARLAGSHGIATGLVSGGEHLGGVVHAAGVVLPGPLSEKSVAEFTVQFAVNVTAVVELTRLLLPALRAGGGTVVLVNSGSGLNARPPLSAYGASKHALRGYADALRQEEPGVRVSTVYPGRTATGMQREVRRAENADYDERHYLQPSTVAGVICSVLALPPDGVITDVSLRPR